MHLARTAAVVAILAFTAAAQAGPAAPVVLTADETAELAARKVVIRFNSGDQTGVVTGIVDVNASVEATMDAVFDLKARVGEVSGLQSVDIYVDQPPSTLAARWEISVVGKAVVFHLKYDIDRPNGWGTFALDTTKENDVKDIQGTYHVYAQGTGSRLVYTSISDTGVYVPGFLKNWLANDSLVEVLETVRVRAEKPR